AGSATHLFGSPFDRALEIYDYPGGYAWRFDGVNPGGGDDSARLKGVFEDKDRTAAIRMGREALPRLGTNGGAALRPFGPGATFTLRVPGRSWASGWREDGKYLLTAVHHRATQSFNVSGKAQGFEYDNDFSCIPVELPFRPLQRAPKPMIQGTQTARVVGL